MENRRGEKGLKWIHRALLLLLGDVFTIAVVYYAALVLRFDFRPWLIPEQYLQGYLWAMPYWITTPSPGS